MHYRICRWHGGAIAAFLVTIATTSGCGGGGGGAGPDAATDTDADTDMPPDTLTSGPDPSGTDTDSDPTGPDEVDCVVDPQLAEMGRGCVRDEHCPCGAHCELGVCVASCVDDTDCSSGQVCDRFGRCRGEAETRLLPPPPTSAPPPFETNPGALVVVPGTRGLFELYAPEGGGDEPRDVRLVAHGDVVIDCGDGWTKECWLHEVEPGTKLEVQVDALPQPGKRIDDPTAVAGKVEIYTDDGHVDAKTVVAPTPEPPETADLQTGRYEGVAMLVGAGIGTDAEPLSSISDGYAIPVQAEVFASGIVRIEDTVGILHPAGVLVGALDEKSGTAAFPDHFVVTGEAFLGDPFEVLAVMPGASLRVAPDGASLSIGLPQHFEGLGPSDETPRVEWNIGLRRVGDPTGDAAPSLPAPDVASLDPTTVGGQRLGWEQAVVDSFAAPGLDGGDPAQAAARGLEFAALASTGASASGFVDLCALDEPSQRAALAPGLRRIEPGSSGGQMSAGLVSDFPVVADPTVIEAFASRVIEARHPGAADGTAVGVRADVASSDFSPDEIPCNVSFLGSGLFGGDSAGVISPFSVDRCDEAATALGCEVRDSAGSTEWSMEFDLGNDGTGISSGTFNAVVSQTCVLPPAPTACPELLLCGEPAQSSDRASMMLPRLTDQSIDVVREAQCASGSRSAGIDLDTRSALPDGDEDRPSAQEAFADCQAELESLRNTAPPDDVAAHGAGLASLVGEAQCIDGPRFVAALAMAGEAARAGITPPVLARGHGGLVNRMVQRWLQLHRFFAAEAIQQHKIASVLAQDPAAGDPPIHDPQAVLDDLAAGYELLLLPRVYQGIAGQDPSVWGDPDYRMHLAGITEPPGEFGVALPVTLLESIDSQMRLAQLRLDKAARTFDPTILDEMRGTLASSIVVRAIAEGLYQRAIATTPDPIWRSRYDATANATTTAGNGFAQKMLNLSSGTNPLGIEDEDLPLYFFGDTVGPGGRFSAISDFLIGDGPNSTAWAPFLVDQAAQALLTARTQAAVQADRDFQARQDAAAVAGRLSDIASQADTTLQDYCGATDGSYVDDPNFNAGSCYVDPTCSLQNTVDLPAYFTEVGPATLGFQLCLGNNMRQRLGNSFGFANSEVAAMAAAVRTPANPAGGCVGLAVSENNCAGDVCMQCQSAAGLQSVALDIGTFNVAVPDGAEVDAAYDACLAAWTEGTSVGGVSPPAGPPARLMKGLPPPVTAPTEIGCLRGSLGEMAAAVVAAEQDLQAARSEAAEHIESYDIAVRSCELSLDTTDAINQANEAHAEQMGALLGAQAAMDIGSITFGALEECAATTVTADKDTLWGAATAVVVTALSCGFGAAEASFDIASVSIGLALSNAELGHENLVTALQAQGDYVTCMNDAQMELVGVRTAAISVERAMTEVQSTSLTLRNAIRTANDVRLQAVGSLAAEGDRFARRPDYDDWLDEALVTYERRFALARRAVYIAVRGVEYEFQQSMAAQADALAAETPDDLEAVLQELWSVAGTQGINGAMPTDLKVVISLRDELLQLADRSGVPPTEQALTAEQRFRLLLTDPGFARYDASGNYLGQQVPFSLVPFGSLGLGQNNGIPVLTGDTDCAERLWSVNASIQGQDVFVGSDTTFARIDLLKRNTFFSQWCGGQEQAGRPFQTVSVRPARNLFREPGVGSEVGGELGVTTEQNLYSRARIEAFFNVDRGELENDEYANGDTSELAARGLYGDYALFIPASVISHQSTNGTETEGLNLDAIDDILLRLDYVSVAN